MAAPRLPFLWPVFFRPLVVPRAATRVTRPRPCSPRSFNSTARRPQGSPTKRYGTAHEPAAHLREQDIQKDKTEQVSTTSDSRSTVPAEEEEDEDPSPTTTSSTHAQVLDSSEATPEFPQPKPPRTGSSKPLETILHMPSPAEEEERKSPHLKTPPYVHHFDTYGLVRDLTKSGFTDEQSITLMKAVRGVLTDNMELARDELVSKSNVENETYLFKAACSELRTELGNKRKAEVEKMRSERNQLQHEVDILNQRLGQETSHLKDELKGLFDDRKMAVRQEQRTMETKNQELNYKITVALNSDARSEVEGLRWVLTRRAAITVASVAVILFLSLKASSNASHTDEKKKAKQNKSPADEGHDPPSTDHHRNANNQEAIGGELLATEGGVSLA